MSFDCEDREKNSPAWGLRGLEYARRRAGSIIMASIGLQDPAQHMMLVHIYFASKGDQLPSQRELSRSMHLSPPTVTATLKLLERDGYVQRIADSNDQRINRVRLTQKGLDILKDGMVQLNALDACMQEGLTAEEQEILCHGLSVMKDNLLKFIHSKEGNAHD